MRILIAGFVLSTIVMIVLLANFINQPVEKITSAAPTTVGVGEDLETLPTTNEKSGITRVEGTTSIEIQPN